MKLMPASTAVFTCSSTASCCSLPMLAQIPAPPPPYVMVPRHNSETYKPVWPNNRYRMPASGSRVLVICLGQAYNQWVKTLRSIALLAAAVGMASCLFELEYFVGGTVTGLKGTGLVLQDNSGSDLRVNANGAFTFSSRVAKAKTYLVTVRTQPSNPAQTCTVHDGSGTIAKADIINIVVSCSQAGRYAYVANQTADTISAFSIDSANGFLTPVPGSPFTSTGAAPVALAVDPNGAFLYVVNSASDTVGIYAINDTTGALTVTGFSVVAGASPVALSVDPTGRYLYVANSGANTVSAFALQNGIATRISGSPFTVGRQPVALQTDPSGSFLYVTDFADGSVTVLAIDGATGALAGISGSPFGAGAGAVSIAVDPAGTFAYVANETAATISAYSIDPTTGALIASGSPLSTASAPKSIAVDPAGNLVYAANVTSGNDVATYAIEPSSGALTLSSTSVAGSLPLAVTVDPSGQFVYVANQSSSNVSVFAVDAATGALAAVAGSPFPAGSGARAIAID